jgi:hypothetical protein
LRNWLEGKRDTLTRWQEKNPTSLAPPHYSQKIQKKQSERLDTSRAGKMCTFPPATNFPRTSFPRLISSLSLPRPPPSPRWRFKLSKQHGFLWRFDPRVYLHKMRRTTSPLKFPRRRPGWKNRKIIQYLMNPLTENTCTENVAFLAFKIFFLHGDITSKWKSIIIKCL